LIRLISTLSALASFSSETPLDRLDDHVMLLDRRQPIDPLVVGKGLVIIGDQARRLAVAEVRQRGVAQMAVDQHIGSGVVLAPRDDQRFDDADLTDRGDNALVAHRLLDGIGHALDRQNVREWQNDDLALKSHFDRFEHVRLPIVRAARPRAAAACASPRRAAT
jgi:hypothetical protein